MFTNNTAKVIRAIGDAKAIDLARESAVSSSAVEIPGFTDASQLLLPGIFILIQAREVVYIGKATGPMLPRIAAMRSSDRPKFLPRVPFDQVLIRKVAPDKLNQLYASLIAEYKPRYNVAQVVPSTIAVENRT